MLKKQERSVRKIETKAKWGLNLHDLGELQKKG